MVQGGAAGAGWGEGEGEDPYFNCVSYSTKAQLPCQQTLQHPTKILPLTGAQPPCSATRLNL